MVFIRSILPVLFCILLHQHVRAQEKPDTSFNKITDSLNSRSNDTDGDAVIDKEDKCINEKGPASNFGCPVIAGKSTSCGLRRYIYFLSGSSSLSTACVKQLKMLVRILKDNPDLYAILVGYTDNLNSADVKLSIARANAAKSYLLKAGIDKSLIKFQILDKRSLLNEAEVKHTKNSIELSVAYRGN